MGYEERISLIQGAGGEETSMLIDMIFGKYFSNKIIDRREDAAVVELQGKTAFAIGGYSSDILKFPGGNIGTKAVCGTCNNLVAMGAVPEYIACSFIIEEGFPLELLDEIAASMAEEAAKAGIQIVAGDTKVIAGNGYLHISTSGVGRIPEGRNVSVQNAEYGDAVIVTGSLGEHKCSLVSALRETTDEFISDCTTLSDLIESVYAEGINIKVMRDITRGGLGTILNEIADSSQVKLQISEEAIPISRKVKAFADRLEMCPLHMECAGKMVLIVPTEQADRTVEILRRSEKGQHAAIIGTVQAGGGVEVYTRMGVKWDLEKLKEDFMGNSLEMTF